LVKTIRTIPIGWGKGTICPVIALRDGGKERGGRGAVSQKKGVTEGEENKREGVHFVGGGQVGGTRERRQKAVWSAGSIYSGREEILTPPARLFQRRKTWEERRREGLFQRNNRVRQLALGHHNAKGVH